MLTFTLVWRVTTPKRLHLPWFGASRLKMLTFTVVWRDTTSKHLHLLWFGAVRLQNAYDSLVFFCVIRLVLLILHMFYIDCFEATDFHWFS